MNTFVSRDRGFTSAYLSHQMMPHVLSQIRNDRDSRNGHLRLRRKRVPLPLVPKGLHCLVVLHVAHQVNLPVNLIGAIRALEHFIRVHVVRFPVLVQMPLGHRGVVAVGARQQRHIRRVLQMAQPMLHHVRLPFRLERAKVALQHHNFFLALVHHQVGFELRVGERLILAGGALEELDLGGIDMPLHVPGQVALQSRLVRTVRAREHRHFVGALVIDAVVLEVHLAVRLEGTVWTLELGVVGLFVHLQGAVVFALEPANVAQVNAGSQAHLVASAVLDQRERGLQFFIADVAGVSLVLDRVGFEAVLENCFKVALVALVDLAEIKGDYRKPPVKPLSNSSTYLE